MGRLRHPLGTAQVKGLLVVGFCVALGVGIAGDHRREPTEKQRVVAEVDRFHTRPHLTPPTLTVETAAPSPAADHIFVAPWRGDGQDGPMILDDRGELVWFRAMPEGRLAMDFRTQRYRGKPVLSWWEGKFEADGYGSGEYVIADSSYQEITRFRAGGGRPGDFHEFLITPRGTALITIYRPLPHDLSPIGGPENGTVVEGIVQEIDIETGRVLLDWRALDHVGLRESHETASSDPADTFDHFHVNSVDIDHDGNLLVSARHTDTIYKIDRRTGEVIWRLGGKRSDFTLGPGAYFSSQHDARRQADGTITLFDNGDPPKVRESSRALTLRLDPETMTATLDREVEHPLGLLSESQGNAQTIAGGEVVVGWGSEPHISRFGADDDVRFEAQFPEKTNVYRAYQANWTGRPTTRPAVAAEADHGQLTVHASWNGDTETATWQLLAGPRPNALSPVVSTAREGFETAITAHTGQPYAAVRAIAESGRTLATSKVANVGE